APRTRGLFCSPVAPAGTLIGCTAALRQARRRRGIARPVRRRRRPVRRFSRGVAAVQRGTRHEKSTALHQAAFATAAGREEDARMSHDVADFWKLVTDSQLLPPPMCQQLAEKFDSQLRG